MEKLSRYEQETIIILNREDKEMEVYTSDPYLIKKLEANDEYQKIKSDKYSATFKADKKLLTLRQKRKAGRQMTDEEKEAARERIIKYHASKKTGTTA